MTRPIVLSNGSLHVGINLFGMVHDFYYPYVGLENHAIANNMRWRIGVWTTGAFSWLDDGSWDISLEYEHSALVERTVARHKQLQLTLELQGAVDADYNAFLRNIHVINEGPEKRDVRLFLHQVMRIGNSMGGDTVQYLPAEPAILHYKGSRVFIVGAEGRDGEAFDQYSVGLYGIEGKEGAYKDAEDGELAGNAVEHGSVDSVIGLTLHMEPHDSARVSYWVAAGLDYREALNTFKRVRTEGIHQRITKTADYWRAWLRPAETFMDQVKPELRDALRCSLLITKAHLDRHGAVIASTDTTMRNYSRDTYAYCWPRDGAFALWPLLRLGYFEEVKSFFSFCRRALQPEGYLMHKYQPDGAIGSSWHPYVAAGRTIPPIQEDETALVIFLLGQYYQATEDQTVVQEYYDSLVRPAANFMAGYIDEVTKLPHATYDLWEEKLLTTTYTTAVTYAALLAAARLAEVMGRQQDAVQWQTVADDMREAAQSQLFNKERGFFYKGFIRTPDANGKQQLVHDETIDVSSFYGAFMFGLFALDSDEVRASYETLEKTFGLQPDTVTPLPRYEHDHYRQIKPSGGNPWTITTLWLAQYYMETDNLAAAERIVHWVQSQALPSGVLPEQLSPDDHRFISVAPLVWSQAELINSIIDLASNPQAASNGTPQ